MCFPGVRSNVERRLVEEMGPSLPAEFAESPSAHASKQFQGSWSSNLRWKVVSVSSRHGRRCVFEASSAQADHQEARRIVARSNGVDGSVQQQVLFFSLIR
jgi:hypothetical protein